MKITFPVRVGALALAVVMAGVGVAGPASAEPIDEVESAGSIVGRLIDQDGDGVPFADVDADGDSTGHWSLTTTDADGYYQLTGLEPDDYRVMFTPPGGPAQFAFGKSRWFEADLIPVAGGEEVVVDDQLLPTGMLTGRFTDAIGEGVEAEVFALPDEGGSFAWASTDSDGFWSMEVVGGHYRVQFEVNEFTQYAFGTTDPFEAEIFEVGAGETVTVDDELIPFGTITGSLTDVHGDGVEAWVRTDPVDDGSWAFGSTDEEGGFTLHVMPGRYRVSFDVDSFTQYAFGTTSFSAAEVFDVGAGETITVDDTLIELGTVAGRFTDASGAGIGDVDVVLEPLDEELDWRFGFTDEEGFYQVSAPPGDYYVRFESWELAISQYAYGALTRAGATPFSVAANETVTVDDTRLPTGSVRVTAEDALTGEPLSEFSFELAERIGHTVDGEVVMSDVPVGSHEITWAWAPGYAFRDVVSVTVVAGEQAEVTLALHPKARIETTVVDAVTGEPLAGVCLIVATPTQVRLPEWCFDVSDEDGNVFVEVDRDGTYQLLAWPRDAEGYGAQWVGRQGGTGDQRRAAKVTVTDGGVATAPVVHMDLAGTVTGTVTDPDGAPVTWGTVRIGNDGFGVGGGLGSTWIDEQGGYTLDFLGPYQWSLLFEVPGHAAQWSGGTHRYAPRGVQVVAGESVGYHHQLRTGTEVTIAPGPPPDVVFAVALNARTGDRVAAWWLDPTEGLWTRPVLGPQRVKFQFFTDHGEVRYLGGDDFQSAKAFTIRPHGEQTLDLK